MVFRAHLVHAYQSKSPRLTHTRHFILVHLKVLRCSLNPVEGQLRSTVQKGLANPELYLGASATPDLCTAYRLHLECGSLINLYDWMQAFNTIVSEAPGEPSANGKLDLHGMTNLLEVS